MFRNKRIPNTKRVGHYIRIVGQSNTGIFPNNNDSTAIIGTENDHRIWVYNRTTAGASYPAFDRQTDGWERLDQVSTNNAPVGAERAAARRLTAHTGEAVFIEKVAVGGAGISIDDNNENWHPDSNEIFDAWDGIQSDAYAQLLALNFNPTVLAIIWAGGERESIFSTLWDDIDESIDRFREQLRIDASGATSETPFVIQTLDADFDVVAAGYATLEAWTTVRDAQVNAALEANTIAVSSNGAAHVDSADVHFSNVGYEDVGYRIGGELINLLT